MKKISKILCLIIAIISILMVSVFATENNNDIVTINATSSDFPENYSMSDGEAIEDDFYEAGDDISITKSIDGNAYLMGQNVVVKDTTIYGNLYVMAKNIEISNTDISGAVYVIGEKISFSGLANDIYAIGSEVKFDESTYVWRSIRVAGEKVSLNGTILRDVWATVKDFEVCEKTRIDGKVTYASANQVEVPASAQINEIEYSKTTEMLSKDNDAKDFLYSLCSFAFKTIIISAILFVVSNKFRRLKRTDSVVSDFIKSGAKGFGVLVGIPVITILLFITAIGVGLGFALIFVYVALLFIASAVASTEIAYRFLSKNQKLKVPNGKGIIVSTVISIVLFIVGKIPFIGSIISFILFVIGLGIIFDMIMQKNNNMEN